MEFSVTEKFKLSHKQFRALLKKFRRKRKRQQLAKLREQQELCEQQKKESSPGYKEREEERLRNVKLLEEFEERERMRKHKEWLVREEMAQAEFRRKQRQLELENIKREEERKRILEEFEKQQYVVNQAEEENKKIKSQKEAALQEALSNLDKEDGPWHNPIAPEHYNVGQERAECMFFSKTGCCRFGERCSRGHSRPDVSCTILIKSMYSHFSIDQTARDDYDTDIALEYEDKECYQDFKNFYNDVLPEFKKFGRVVQFKVCNNFEPHLRGNVYIQYASEKAALEAYKNFNGRYYAGKQLTCEFTNVNRWRSALCGLYSRKLCPKGMNCNFLHTFKNPYNEFWDADHDHPLREEYNSHSSRNRNHAKSERYNGHSSEHRYYSGRHESRSSRYEPSSDRHSHRSDRRESRSERHESRSDRYESRSERYESRSDRRESKSDKYESRNSYNESLHDDISDDYYHSSRSRKEETDERNSKYEKDRESLSRSKSPPEVSSEKKSSHKKKKHKKKSKKRKKEYSSDSDSDVE